MIGCSNGGDQWIIDNTPDAPFPNCPATNGQLTGFAGKLNRGLSNGKANYNAVYFQAEKPFTDQSTWGFTTALTLQRARSNVAQELNSDEFFNGPNLDTYGWGHVNGVHKWMWVTSANYRAPFGIVLSAQLDLKSGPAFGNIIAPWNGLTVRCRKALAASPTWAASSSRRRTSATSASTFAWRRPSRCRGVMS